MQQENIRLKNAMKKGANHVVCTWYISGLHVKTEDLPSKSEVVMTFVMKCIDTSYMLGIIWNKGGQTPTYHSTIGEFSTLEELEKNFPDLCELVGSLYAFP